MNKELFIIFDRKILKDRFKILSNYHRIGTLWIDGKICEIVMTSSSIHRFVIPFKETNITSLFQCTIEYSIYKTSLENCSSPDISITFNENKIYFEEKEFTPKIRIRNPVLKSSISYINNNIYDNIEFEIPDNIVTTKNNNNDENNHNKDFNTLRYDNKGEEGCIFITSFKDIYNIDKKNIIMHKINMNDFNNNIVSFIIPSKKISLFIKKLTSSKVSTIQLKFIKKQYVTLEAIRNDNYGISILNATLLDCKKTIENIYELEMKYLSSLKKLSTLSISDNNNYNKDKKIFENILFEIIEKNKVIIGLTFYPHPNDINNNFNASDYFSFFPLKKL